MGKRKVIIMTAIILLICTTIVLSLILNSKNKRNKKSKEETAIYTDEINLEEATEMMNSLYKNEYNKIEIKEIDGYFEVTIINIDTNTEVNKFKLDKETGIISSIESVKTKTGSGSSE